MTAIVAHGSHAVARPFGAFATLRSALRAWNQARQTRNALARLTDHELNDIGICRFDIEEVARCH